MQEQFGCYRSRVCYELLFGIELFAAMNDFVLAFNTENKDWWVFTQASQVGPDCAKFSRNEQYPSKTGYYNVIKV